MNKIKINLFGLFEARVDGVPVHMPTRRVELILALLAINLDKALSRSTLAATIWPGQADAQALASLRQAIFRLRNAIGTSDTSVLEVTTSWLKLKRAGVVLDVDALHDPETLDFMPDGAPLDGLVANEPELDERLNQSRAELRTRFMSWLEKAEDAAVQARRFDDLERLARKHLALDAYDERALRMLMTALWRQGRRNSALELFQDASRRIRTDLSVSVQAETTELFQAIRQAQRRDASEAIAGPVESASEQQIAEPVAKEASTFSKNEPHLRHLAVMSVASDRILFAERNRDPEAAEAGGRAAMAAIEAVVKREGGEIAGRAGHHVVCVFGATRPDENPALSAAFAAFEIARQDCAVGLHAGRALVGGDIQNYPLYHIAQSLADAAGTGETRLTALAHEACQGVFLLEEAEAIPVEGLDAKRSWRLAGEALSRSGFDIRRARGLSRFIGRDAELAMLERIARSSEPRVVVIVGEAGIGKSRLVHEFQTTHAPEHFLRVQFAKGEAGGGIDRFKDILTTLFGDTQNALASLKSLFSSAPLHSRFFPPLAALLGDEMATRNWLSLVRTQRMQGLADALLALIEMRCGHNTLLLVEDAHWTDEDGAALLDRMVRSLHGQGPMIIVTQRPGTADTWAGFGAVQLMTLQPLGGDDAAQLIASLGHNVTEGLLTRGGGVPLFLEELASTSASNGEIDSVPETLNSLLLNRIDALPAPYRRVIEAAAVLGAEPSDDMLFPLSGLRSEAYEAALSGLADADILYRIRSIPQRVYGFKHALVQDAAYEAIPKTRRQELHARVVEMNEPRWQKGDRNDGASLARHMLGAGQWEKAIGCAYEAADQALMRSSFGPAKRALDIAYSAVRQLPPEPAFLRKEAEILIRQRPVLWMIHRSDIEAKLDRCETLAVELDDKRLLAEVCAHRAYLHSDDGQVHKALAYCDKCFKAAQEAGDADLVAESAMARCQTFSLQGKMQKALFALEGYIETWDANREARGDFFATRFVWMRFLLVRSCAALGHGTKATSWAFEGLDAAQRTGRPADRYLAVRAVGELFAQCGLGQKAAIAFKLAADIAHKADLERYAIWAEIDLADVELHNQQAKNEDWIERLEMFAKAQKSYMIVQMQLETVLACHKPDSSETEIGNLLAKVDALDMPRLRLRLLEEVAKRKFAGAENSKSEIKGILKSEGYAQSTISEEESDRLMNALSKAAPSTDA